MITALCIVSASEVALVKPDFTYEWAEDNPEEFNKILYGFGMEADKGFEIQDGDDGNGLLHKNKLNKVVQCRRWVGHERTDAEWLTSGYASRFAIDKSSGSKLLEDLYKQKGYY